MKSHLVSILAFSGLFVGGALLLFRRRPPGASQAPAEQEAHDERAEDFTFTQEAVLQRVREIWTEYCNKSHVHAANE